MYISKSKIIFGKSFRKENTKKMYYLFVKSSEYNCNNKRQWGVMFSIHFIFTTFPRRFVDVECEEICIFMSQNVKMSNWKAENIFSTDQCWSDGRWVSISKAFVINVLISSTFPQSPTYESFSWMEEKKKSIGSAGVQWYPWSLWKGNYSWTSREKYPRRTLYFGGVDVQ